MRAVNIQSLLSIKRGIEEKKLSQETLEKYITYLYDSSKSPLKDHEWETLQVFADHLDTPLDGFYLSYSIPQIGKEFDLIRLGETTSGKYLLNIEIKREADAEKIKKQLLRNRYYLNFSQRNLLLYSFDASTKTLYKMEQDEVKAVEDLIELKNFLNEVSPDTTTALDALFNPSNYLISPFNTTEEFLKQEYFLTEQQEEIKNKILKFVNNPQGYFSSITGAAGTGKTLLTYDIAMTLMKEGKKVIILHCAPMNEGQHLLVNDYNWDIRCARDTDKIDSNDYDLIIIDEAQRIRNDQWKAVEMFQKKCILSFDENQYLSDRERREDFKRKIQSLVRDHYYAITDKIRTNKEVADFLKQLFDRKKNFTLSDGSKNIEFYHFTSKEEIISFQQIRLNSGWTIPKYTPSIYGTFHYEGYTLPNSPTAHNIIGQEYDHVLAIIDNSFKYDEEGVLITNPINSSNTYSLERMFYQIVTRARKKLCIAILNNREIFNRCLDILTPKER